MTKVYDGSGTMTSTETYQYDGDNFLTSSTIVFSDGRPDETRNYVTDAAGRILEATFPIFGGMSTETNTYYSDGLLATASLQLARSPIISDRTSTFYYPPNQPTWQGEGFWIRAERVFEEDGATENIEDNLFSQGGRLTSQKRFENGQLIFNYQEATVETVSCEEIVEPVCTECGSFGGTQIKFKIWFICFDGCFLPFFARIAQAFGGLFSCGTC